MKYSLLFGSILAVSASTNAFSEEMESFQNITSNNAYSANNTVSKRSIDLNSIWYNPALVINNGQQANLNIVGANTGSFFINVEEQFFGLHIGRDAVDEFGLSTTDNNAYDVFWAKEGDDQNMGAHVYWSTNTIKNPSTNQISTTSGANFDILSNSYTIQDDPEDDDNKFKASIDKNKQGSFVYDFGAEFGIYSDSSQMVASLQAFDSEGDYNNFKANWTNTVAGVDTEESHEVVTKNTQKHLILTGDYVQVKTEELSFLAQGQIVLSNNRTNSLSDVDNGTSRTYLLTDTSTKTNDIRLSAGVDYTIRTSDKVSFNIQQIASFNLDLNSDTNTTETSYITVGETKTESPTGVTSKTTQNGYTFDAPVSITMNMQATKKFGLIASIATNALSVTSTKSKNIEMILNTEGTKYIEGITSITGDEIYSDTSDSVALDWGFSYQINNNLVLDFVSKNDIIVNGITSGISNHLTMTYKF
ncbi:hypothetical protein [Marinicellulosiphila megalodicopiae]|uniref:hypothetical protein n=1 Tax=Marinicellulosiphila megalodicopiae TaxID=2724896 RepID=UPI003BB157E2